MILCCLAWGARFSRQPALAGELLIDVARERGISFTNVNGASGKKYLPETMLGGAAWLDFDGDGFLDLYLVQGHRHPERALDGPGGPEEPGNVLYRNLDGKRFEDVSKASGADDRGYGMGAAVGDHDGDGSPDLYVTNYGRNVLYRNRGDGTFEDVTARAGVGAGGWSSSASWADYDGDGRLDLYVARYLEYDTRKHGACSARVPGSGKPVASYCHPHHFEGAADLLYHNQGDGTFRDASRESGIAGSRGWLEAKGLGVVASDFDGDGDVDFLVANDSVPNALWKNLGGGRFENAALEAGFALDGDGAAKAGMGLARGDADSNGTMDFFITNFSRETNTLYLNLGGSFQDATVERRLARSGYLTLGFGACFFDLDLDGDLDLYAANGHILDNVEEIQPGENITYGERDLLFENDGRGFFTDLSARAGSWFQSARVGRGVAAGDYDNDGDLDLLVTHVSGPAALLENRAGDGKPWVGLDLRAEPGAGTVYGARVELSAGGRRQVFEVETDGSYLCAHDPRVRFALPPDLPGGISGEKSAKIRVRWPDSREEVLPALAPGRYHQVVRKPKAAK